MADAAKMSLPGTAAFYDRLAPHYHLLYGDWQAAVERQGRALSALLLDLGVGLPEPIHDAACGIGTQTLGLAGLGHRISASDISPAAVARLASEAEIRKLDVPAQVDDLRHLRSVPPGSMGALLACDNSVPHLLSDAEILQAFQACWRGLRPGGVLVLSVRDYAATPRVSPDVRPYGIRQVGDSRFLAVQVWEWDGEQYDLRIYVTTEASDGRCETQVMTSRYYAVPIERLEALLEEAGFIELRRYDDLLFQPVLAARRPHAARGLPGGGTAARRDNETAAVKVGRAVRPGASALCALAASRSVRTFCADDAQEGLAAHRQSSRGGARRAAAARPAGATCRA